MSWFVPMKEAEELFTAFFDERTTKLNMSFLHAQTLQKQVKGLSRLILTNQPVFDTCFSVCEYNYSCDCNERSSNYCQITTNSDDQFDRVDWRRQAFYFNMAVKKHSVMIEKIIGQKRINYFLAQINELGRDNLKQIKRSERDEYIKKFGEIPEIELEPVTIQDMADDPWSKFIKSKQLKEEHLLTCSP